MRMFRKVVSLLLLCSMMCYTMPIMAYTNDENIYIKMDSKGNPYRTIVTTTELDQNGNEETVEKEVSKELPFECNISYTLNGQSIDENELIGKSGKVTIKLDFTNKLINNVKVNNTIEKLYTPLFVVAGTIIDNENNLNIEVTKGKVIDNGNKSIVVGMALPGMEESLKLSKDIDIDIPSSIEIKMDTKSFELNNVMMYTSTKVFDETIDFDGELDELYDSINSLQDAANKLEDGTNKLKDGTIKLNDGAGELNNGAGALADGVVSLKEGTTK